MLTTVAVILCSIAAAALLLCVLLALLTVRFGDRARLWAKSLREPRHRGWRFGSPSSAGAGSCGASPCGSSSVPPRYHPAPDHPPPPPPFAAHPEYQRHHGAGLPRPQLSGSDDEYYYVATWKDREASGKHIPVTVL